MIINIFLLIIKTSEEENIKRYQSLVYEIGNEIFNKKTSLIEIQTDFEKMEKKFSKNFDKLINNY